MADASFAAGTYVAINKTIHRLVRKFDDGLWQLEEVRTKRITELSDLELRRLYCDAKLRFVSEEQASIGAENNPCLIKHRTYSEEELEVARLRRLYVMEVIDMPRTQATIRPLIRALWLKLKKPDTMPSPANVIRWVNRYLAAGKSHLALIDNHSGKGNRASRYPDEVLDFVKQALETTFLTRERKTLQDAVDKARVLVDQENKLRPQGHPLPLPTQRLVKRVLESMPASERHVARYGKTAARKEFRTVLGHSVAERPLLRAEVDHTKLDGFVIDDETGAPLGRPWLTAIIDVASRCVQGFYLGFQPPSVSTVAYCLKHALLPKLGLKETYPDIRNEWEAHGVMDELVVDGGLEFHSNRLRDACYALGIEIHFSPRKTPWFKGKIERLFAELNRGVMHGNPGTTFSNIFEKDDYDPAKHAVIRLSTLHQMVNKWIVDVYHQKPHSALDGMSPAKWWASAIALDEIRLPPDPRMFDAIFAKQDRRILTHKGILVDGLLYNSPALAALREQRGSRLDVEVGIDDERLDRIFVSHPSLPGMLEVPALDINYTRGLTRHLHGVYQRYATERLELQDGLQAWETAKDEISTIVLQELERREGKSNVRVARFQEHQRGLGTASRAEDAHVADLKKAPLVAARRAAAASLLPPQAGPAPESAIDFGLQAPAVPRKYAALRRDRSKETNDMHYAERTQR